MYICRHTASSNLFLDFLTFYIEDCQDTVSTGGNFETKIDREIVSKRLNIKLTTNSSA